MVLATTIFWMVKADFSFDLLKSSQFLIILLLIGFGLLVGLRRLKSEKIGQPAEVELSKKIMQKACSVYFSISLYLWLALMYMGDKIKIPNHSLFGLGILGMAIIFALSWIYYSFFG